MVLLEMHSGMPRFFVYTNDKPYFNGLHRGNSAGYLWIESASSTLQIFGGDDWCKFRTTSVSWWFKGLRFKWFQFGSIDAPPSMP